MALIKIFKPLSTFLLRLINLSNFEVNFWECQELNPGLLGENLQLLAESRLIRLARENQNSYQDSIPETRCRDCFNNFGKILMNAHQHVRFLFRDGYDWFWLITFVAIFVWVKNCQAAMPTANS